MITIEVTVSDGKVPAKISLVIDSEGSLYNMTVREKPFKENFNLGKGKHEISILGKNPEGGKATIKVSGTDSKNKQIETITKEKVKDHYSATIILNL